MGSMIRRRYLNVGLTASEEVVLAVAQAVEARDTGNGEHCERLATLAVRLGAHLGLPEKDLLDLQRAGYVHDIGKIAVPVAVLLKPNALSEDEQQLMRRMIEQAESIGANAVLNVRYTTTAATMGAAEILAYGSAVMLE